MFTFDIRKAGRQICLALQSMTMSPGKENMNQLCNFNEWKQQQQQQTNLLDSKMLGSLSLNYCYSCDFRIWSACPCDCRLKYPKEILNWSIWKRPNAFRSLSLSAFTNLCWKIWCHLKRNTQQSAAQNVYSTAHIVFQTLWTTHYFNH